MLTIATAGYALKMLTELMASFLEQESIKQLYKGRLVGAVLTGYLSLRRLVVQRTRLIDETQEKLLELLEEMTTGDGPSYFIILFSTRFLQQKSFESCWKFYFEFTSHMMQKSKKWLQKWSGTIIFFSRWLQKARKVPIASLRCYRGPTKLWLSSTHQRVNLGLDSVKV